MNDLHDNDIPDDPYAERRAAAIAWLGERWVYHPDYDPSRHPQHNFSRVAEQASTCPTH